MVMGTWMQLGRSLLVGMGVVLGLGGGNMGGFWGEVGWCLWCSCLVGMEMGWRRDCLVGMGMRLG